MRSTSLLCVLFLAACQGSDLSVIASLPETVDWVAITAETDGTIAFSTGLLRFEPGKEIRIEQEGELLDATTVRMSGYEDGILREAFDLKEEVMANAPIRLANADEPILPNPSWTGLGAIEGDTAAVTRADLPPQDLTVSWLPPCPQVLDTEAMGDVDCSAIFCDARAKQSDCNIDVSFSCGLEPINATLSARGLVNGGTQDAAPCGSVEANPSAALAMLCGDCGVSLYLPPFERDFDFQTISVIDGAPVVQSVSPPFSGYLNDLAVIESGQTVVVISNDGRENMEACTGPTRAHFYRDQTLIHTATTPACLRMIVPDPTSDGFIGVYNQWSHVGRFDPRGMLVESASISASLPKTSYDLSDMVLANDRIALALSPPSGATYEAAVALIDAQTLKVVLTVQNDWKRLLSLSFLGGNELASGILPEEGIQIINLASGQITGRLRPLISGDLSKHADFLFHENGIFLLSDFGDRPGWSRIFVMDSVDSLGAVVLFEWAAQVGVAHRWPGSPHVVVNVFAAGERSELALLDVDGLRFLPGTVSIGQSPVGRIVRDGQDRLWMSQPWSGDVVVLEPQTAE